MGMGFVAAGFRSIADTFSLMDGSGTSHGLSDAITVLNAQAAITSLTILGHSLGSALATLAAAQLASQNPAGVKPLISVWTYASPRVGLADFMGNYNNEVPANYRIWNSLDLVPQVPVYPYVHVGGDGEKLDQSEQEMQELETTPGCEHNLATYQWLLDTKDFQIPQGCAIVADLATAAAPEVIGAHAMEAAPSAAGERAQGRSAMYRAMHGV
jgi:pimeloyl-ACP methyl ester carboxylesterase